MAIYTKTFTKRATVVPDPKVGGAWKTDTFEWSPLPAENCLLVDGQIQTASCRGLDVQPTVLWQIAANTYSAARPCVVTVHGGVSFWPSTPLTAPLQQL